MKKVFCHFRTRKICVIAAVAVLFLAACTLGIGPLKKEKQPNQKPIPVMEYEESPQYRSDTTVEDCLLCNGGQGTLLPLYWNQENVGLISLNTFKVSRVEINRYDDRGKPIEKPVKGSSSHILSTGDGGFTSLVSESPNRGYAHASITFNDEVVLDLTKAGGFLCTACLNRVMEKSWSDEPYGIGVIDFMTKDIRLLESNISSFMFNDYYISCHLRAKREEDSSVEMDLLIFYCPERYGSK